MKNKSVEMELALPQVPMLSVLNVDNIRQKQRNDGHFDCFGRASSGYCDQHGCAYRPDCLDVSQIVGG